MVLQKELADPPFWKTMLLTAQIVQPLGLKQYMGCQKELQD